MNPIDAAAPTLMIVGAHHDDNELFAGTLAAHRRAGWNVVSVVVTEGSYIDGKISSQHIPRRESESQHAAKLLGMQCAFLRIPEGTLVTTETHLKLLISQLRKWRPQMVITHPPVDYHHDHEWVSRLTRDVVQCCWNPAIVTSEPPCDVPMLYYGDAWFVPFDPDEYVDITPFIELKRQMLACHQSQLPAPQSTLDDFVTLAVMRSRQRGFESGVPYAEAFRLAPRLGRQRLSRLLGATEARGEREPQCSIVEDSR